jgi:sporulation protein YlmC with PRC-barrel domain
MKKRNWNLVWGTVLVAGGMALWPREGLAQNTVATTPNSAVSSSGTLSHVERAANLFGRELMSSDNQKIGKVQNLVVDLPSEHVLYVGVHTDQGPYVAVPPQLFGNSTGSNIGLNASRQQIESAPKFTSSVNQPEQLGQVNFLGQVYQHFGQNEWWQNGIAANPGWLHSSHKLNELIGMRIQDPQSKALGKASNLVVDLPTGHILYVVLTPDSSLNLGDNLYAVPSDSLHLTSDRKALTMDTDPQKLAEAPHFAKNNWPNLTDPTFASQVYQYYGKSAWFGNASGTSPGAPTGR